MSQGKPFAARLSAARLVALMLAMLATLACASATTLLHLKTAAASQADGLAAYAAGDYDQAMAAFTQAIATDPKLAEAYYARGELHYLLDEVDLAIADFSSAIDNGYAPAAQAYSARADAYYAAADYERGSQDYNSAFEDDEDFAATVYPARLQAYSQAITLHPELPGPYLARARLNGLMQDYAAAVADYTSAIAQQPEPDSDTFYARAWAYYAVGDFESGIADFSQVIELVPASVEAYDGRGQGRILLADYDRGLEDFQRANEIDPNYANGQNNYCWYGSLLGHAAEVMDACERAVALAPNIPAYADSRGLARALTGDYAGAIADFQSYVDFLTARGRDDKDRSYWISELQAGRNPCDEATLKALIGN